MEALSKINEDHASDAHMRLMLSDDDSITSIEDLVMRNLEVKARNSRYLFRNTQYRTSRGGLSSFDWEGVLSGDPLIMSDSQFLQSFRMTRQSFIKFIDLIKGHDVFKTKSPLRRTARPVAHQALVFLYRLGKEGTSGSCVALSSYFHISQGSIHTYIENVITATMSLKHRFVRWHTQEEREAMKARCYVNYGFKHCIISQRSHFFM